MTRPKFVGVGTKSQFRRAVPKSYSYRYEVGPATGPGNAPQISAVIETRYRGKSASWNLSRSALSRETWTLNGTYVAPASDNLLAYPPKEPPEAVVAETQTAPVAPPPPVAPSATAVSAASNRIASFGRKLVTPAERRRS